MAFVSIGTVPTFGAHPSARGDQLWVHRYDGPQQKASGAWAMALSPDGSKVFVSGIVGSSDAVVGGRGLDIGTVAYDALTGELLWEAIYAGSQNDDQVLDMAVSPDGTMVFVTGKSNTGVSPTDGYPTADFLTVAYAASNGEELWRQGYNGASGGEDGSVAIVTAPDGSAVFVTGSSKGPQHGYDFVTFAYSARTGERLWGKRHARSNYQAAAAMAISPGGSILVVTGFTHPGETGPDSDFLTIAYSAVTGERLWGKRYASDGENRPAALTIAPNGSKVYVTGTNSTRGDDRWNAEYATIAYRLRTGRQAWISHEPGPEGARPEAVVVSPDGARLFITGWISKRNGDTDYGTVAYDARTGQRLWTDRYDAGGSFDGASSLAMSRDGSAVFVTGRSDASDDPDSSDYATIAYSASDGQRLWESRYDGPTGAIDLATAVAASADGTRVFVTGASEGVYGVDGFPYATVAYAAR